MADAIIDGDRGFTGVDERRDAGQLEPSLVSSAVNFRFGNSEAETRKGIRAPRWAAPGTFSFPFDFPLPCAGNRGVGNILDEIPFTSRLGSNYSIIALKRFALRKHESGTFVTIRYPLDLELDDIAGPDPSEGQGRDRACWAPDQDLQSEG